MLEGGRSLIRFPMMSLIFFPFLNLPDSSSCTLDLVTLRPLTEMSTKNLPVVKGWLARKAKILAAICDPTA
jgi:hypothetical protein